MQPIGALQPRLPSPIDIQKGNHKIILDLKDGFYVILLAPKDCQRFAFSVLSINFKEPMKRYQWCILSLGMSNSAALYQKFVAQATQNVWDQDPQIYIVHYMNDILLDHKDEGVLPETYGLLK